jgi:molecular chaperone GrpE (heat shock protein)
MNEVFINYVFALAFLGVLIYLLWVLIKVHGNAKTIDSPENINRELDDIRAEINRLTKKIHLTHEQTINQVVKLHDDAFHKLHDDSLKRSEQLARAQEHVVRIFGDQAAKFAELEAVLSAIRDQASHTDQQLRRFQDGYHRKINEALVLGIIRLLDTITEEEEILRDCSDPATINALQLMRDHLEVLLTNEGVEPIFPELHGDISDYRATAKSRPLMTTNQAEHNKIARVVRPGYRVDTGTDVKPFIRHAEVEVFKFANEGTTG